MGINLQKGQRISLKKEAPSLSRLMCALGWDVVDRSRGLNSMFKADYDLDASVLCLDENDQLKGNSNVVYFGNLSHQSGSITHLGDNLTGAGEGDDEQIIVDLPKIPTEIAKLVFVVNIYDAVKRKHDFGQVENAFVRLVDLDNNQEIARYTLSGNDYQGKTSMLLAEVYRHNDEWKMAAVGNGLELDGLQQVVNHYL
ncbi:MAG: TerD family protein [Cyanobacteria bacterium]|jgi:stress response protein SCP2|nr:TerD family protein [Cyanobacteria bacterium GSL.Bin1]